MPMKPALWPLVALLSTISTAAVFAGSADWPQWRGPNRTDISTESGLLKSWPEGGPKRIWLFNDAGLGYSGPAIVDGKLYTMGIRQGAEQLIAVDAKEGKALWQVNVGEILK